MSWNDWKDRNADWYEPIVCVVVLVAVLWYVPLLIVSGLMEVFKRE